MSTAADVRSKLKNDDYQQRELRTEPGETSTPSIRALFTYTEREHIPVLSCAIACSLISSAAKPIQAFLTGKVFDVFIRFATGILAPDELINQQRTWILYLVAVAGASWLISALEFIFWIRFGDLQAERARSELYAGLMAADIGWYDTCEGGIDSYLPSLQSQIRELQLATSQPLGIVLAAISTALASLGQAFYNSWNLTLVTLAGGPLIVVAIGVLGTLTQRAIYNQETARVELQSQAFEILANVETVKCFNAQDMECKRYTDGVAKVAAWYMKIVQSNTWQLCILTFLVQSMFVQAFYYGGVLIRNGSKQPSEVITIFFSAISAFLAIQGIVPQMVVIDRGKLAGVTLKALVPAFSTTTHESNSKPSKCYGGFELCTVSFRYPARPDRLALDNVSLSFTTGSFTFLVGASGSGKSTIGQLLNRFYDVDQGSILLDGEPLHTLDIHWLRSQVLLVEQASTLFSGTIEENILLGKTREDIPEDSISLALEFALLAGMVNDLPDGVKTKLGHIAQSISGGQRQRLALARARLIDPPILILDESTSALDQATRDLMMAAVRTWRQGRTTIIITHDLTQIEATDQLIVLNAERIVEHGTRRELEDSKGSIFASLLRSDVASKQLPPDPPFAPLSSRMSYQARQGSMFWRSVSIYLDNTSLEDRYLSPSRHKRRLSIASRDSRVPSGILSHLDPPRQRRSTVEKTVPDVISCTTWSRSPASAQDIDGDPQSSALAQFSLFQMSKLLWVRSRPLSRARIVVGIAAGTVHAACLPTFSYILAKLLALYAEAGDMNLQSIRYSIAILGLAAGDALSTYLYRWLIEQASQEWVDALRRQAMQRLLRQPHDFFDKDRDTAGALVETLDEHAEEMRNLFGRFIIMLWIAAAILATSFVWALTSEWKLTLLCITAAPYVFLVAQAFTRVSEYWEQRCLEAWHEVNLVFGEAFGKVRTVRSLAIEEHFNKRYVIANDRLLQLGMQRSIWTGVFYGLSSSAEHFATALVFYLGSKLAHDGSSIVSILQVFSILILSLANITGILGYVPQMSLGKEMSWRVLRLANIATPSPARPESTHIGSVGPIVLRQLSFAYPTRPGLSVLKNISLTVQPGVTTAIVGGSGSGKSTIGKLLLKLYVLPDDVSAPWRIKISGRDIRTISAASIRAVTAIVAQDAPLFHTTIADNITYGLPADSEHASMASITSASKQAGIYDFIASLPDGFSTIVGAKGIGLSGGQSQRIAIARALVRRPSLLILDEATSALDSQSSSLVRKTIRRLVQQRDQRMTIIMITHSRNMMACADQIVVLDQGRIAEVGPFQRLLQHRGHLARLLNGGSFDE